MIYQHVNKITKILPLTIFHITHLCNQFNHVYTANFLPRFKSHDFCINSFKIRLFLKKKQNFQGVGALPPDPRACGGWGFAPRPSKQPPIANFWLHDCLQIRCCNTFFFYTKPVNFKLISNFATYRQRRLNFFEIFQCKNATSQNDISK